MQEKNPVVVMETTEGDITVELWKEEAPSTVLNFLKYVDEGYYDGTIFHRVIKDFMIQGGGFTPDMVPKPTHPPIQNEARPELKNDRGTIAMARTSVIHSATSQFFINAVDNDFLNFKNATPAGYGYAVFGRVTDGLDVVDKILAVPTKNVGPHGDVPVTPIVIQKIRRL